MKLMRPKNIQFSTLHKIVYMATHAYSISHTTRSKYHTFYFRKSFVSFHTHRIYLEIHIFATTHWHAYTQVYTHIRVRAREMELQYIDDSSSAFHISLAAQSSHMCEASDVREAVLCHNKCFVFGLKLLSVLCSTEKPSRILFSVSLLFDFRINRCADISVLAEQHPELWCRERIFPVSFEKEKNAVAKLMWKKLGFQAVSIMYRALMISDFLFSEKLSAVVVYSHNIRFCFSAHFSNLTSYHIWQLAFFCGKWVTCETSCVMCNVSNITFDETAKQWRRFSNFWRCKTMFEQLFNLFNYFKKFSTKLFAFVVNIDTSFRRYFVTVSWGQ